MASVSRIVVPVVTFVAVAGLQALYAVIVERRAKRRATDFGEGTFDYQHFDLSWLRVLLFLPFFAFAVWALVRMSRSFIEVGWFLSASMCVFTGLFCIVFGGGIVPTLIQIGDTRRRRQQRVSADTSGLTYESGAKRVTAGWDQISDYYITPLGGWATFPSRYVVVITRGVIDFTTNIRDHRLLIRLIEQRAIHAAVTDWAVRRAKSTPGYGQLRQR